MEKECVVDNTIIQAVKWFDNKGVSLLTTFDSAYPLRDVSRYDQKIKSEQPYPAQKWCGPTINAWEVWIF